MNTRTPVTLAIAFGSAGAIYVKLLRPWYRTWGASDEEIARPMPLDARMGRHQEETNWTSLKHFLEEQQTPMPSPMDEARAHA